MKRLKASFTIEASVIIPLTMVIMVWIFFLAFYLHDRVIIGCSGSEFILENIKDGVDADEVKSAVEERIIIADDIYVDTDDEEKNSVSTSGTFNLPDMISDNGVAGSSVSLSALSPRSEVLKYKAIADGAQILTGDNEDED